MGHPVLHYFQQGPELRFALQSSSAIDQISDLPALFQAQFYLKQTQVFSYIDIEIQQRETMK